MLKMVDGIGIIRVDMICPLGVSTPQPPNYDRVELEGTGMLVLPNSLDAPLERLELGGKMEQAQTAGAQLLKPKDGSYTVFGASVDIANGEIKLSGTATSSGGRTIRLSEPFLLKAGTYSSEVDGKIDFILSKNSDNSYLTNLLVKNFNVNEDTEVYVGLNVMAQNTYNNKYHIMLNSGNIPLPYEPYTGGKPSPSPEYPQEIKNSGKWNEEKQKYEVDVKITNAEQNWSKEQTLTITSDRPITKWDRLVEQGGQIGWLYESNRMVLYGSSVPWVKSIKPENIYFATTINNAFGGKGASFCKTYRNIQDSAYEIKYANERCIYSDHPTYTSGDKFFRAPNENVTTLEQWKELIDENPIEMLYHTKNSEFIPLPQSEQSAIRALKTYYPTTVITVDGGELDPDIKATYRKEI